MPELGSLVDEYSSFRPGSDGDQQKRSNMDTIVENTGK